MRKRILGLLATVMLFIGVCIFGGQSMEVDAAAGDITAGDGFVAVEYSDLTQYRTENENIAPDAPDAYADYIFAGWYQDAKCEKVYSGVSADTTLAYAKFVPSGVLSVKAQLKADASKDANTNMRLVSSVDSLLYEEVGFEIYYNGAETPVKANSTKVYQRIVASTASGVDYNYSPKVIDVESEYFVTATLVNINKDNFGNGFYIKPYWVTLDGTVVYGVNKYVTVNNGLDSANINLTIKADAAFTEPLTVTVDGTEYPATLALYDNVSYYDGTYNYVNVTVENKDSVLPSLSEITVTDGTTTGAQTEYRNLLTKYVGTTASIDTSWYSEDEDKYIIATSADLYGLSNVIMKQSVDFADKEIYVISDIEVNKGRATATGWSLVEEDGETAIDGATNYAWSKIGTYGTPFAGTFDGQGHTISGISYSGTEAYYGFFGKTSNSTIKNFKLKNSSFVYSGTSIAYLGGIAGSASGTFENIKSEAYISSTHQNNGGIVGQADGAIDITGCWYSGTMTLVGTNAKYAGGIVGIVSSNIVASMEQCLFDGTITGDATGTEGYGGLCGHIYGSGELSISDSVVLGAVSSAGNNFIGTIVGYIYGNTSTAVFRVNNTYIKNDVCTNAIRVRSGEVYYEDDAVVTKNITSSAYKKAVNVDDITGYKAWYNAHPILSLDYEEYWCLADSTTPQLRKLAEAEDILITLEGEGTEVNPWVITEKEELIAFSDMAQEHDFSGKFVSIGTEDKAGTLTIVLNEGATVDEVKANAVAEGQNGNWTAIGSSALPFNGTFNGNGNTISGIYLVTSKNYQGFFGCTGNNSTIQNFELTNSYIESTMTSGNGWIGSVAGCLYGECNTVKSDATVVSNTGNSGGMIGVVYNAGSAEINNCWFAGKLILGTSTTQCGGVVGSVRLATGKNYKVSITNCLNTGEITGSNGQIGGICGIWQAGDANALTITDCFNAKNVNCTKGHTGGIIGRVIPSGLTISNSYAVQEDEDDTVKIYGSGTIVLDRSEIQLRNIIQGYGAWYNNSAVLNLDFENYWCLVDGVTPQLRSFTGEEDILPMLEGQGTEESPWLITKAEDLSNLATIAKSLNFSEKYVSIGTAENAGELTITINPGDTVAEVKANAVAENGSGNWTPIGSAALPFAGTFNGNGNTISGLYYKGTDTYVGLFGCTANSSTIKNLKLSNTCYFESQNSNTTARMGSIAGCVQGTLDTIKSEATVVSIGHENGGIAGAVNYSGAASTSVKEVKFTNVWFDGTMTMATSVGRFAGGIVGKIYAPNRDIVIEHCLVSGTITGTRTGSDADLGGICGQANSYRKLSINDSMVTSVIQNQNTGTGAIIGRVDDSDSYTLQNVYGVDGLAGNEVTYDHAITGTRTGTVSTESANYSVVDIEDAKGTDVWYNNTLTLDFENYWSPVVDGTPELKSFSTNAVDLWSGQGTQSSPWIITNKAELEVLSSLAQTYNFEEKYFQLGTDEQAGELTITVNEGTVDEIKASSPANWVPIGRSNKAFNGYFNGNGNTISGLYYNGTGTYVGLFSVTGVDAEIKNLKIANSYFKSSATGNVHIGSVAGVGYGTFNNVKSEAEVVCCGSYGGGLVGSVWQYGGATYNDCWFAGELSLEGSSAAKCGGILGGCKVGSTVTQVDMTNCLNTGTINISLLNTGVARVGGICGMVEMNLNITNCLNAKSFVTTRSRASAIVGEAYSATTTLQNIYAIEGDGSATTYNSTEYCGHITNGTVNLVDESWAKLTAEQLAGANAQTYAASLFAEDEDGNVHWVVGDLYPTLNMAGEVYDLIPTMTVSTSENTETILTGDGNFVTTVTGTTIDNYTEYAETLVASKFEKVAENTITDTVYSTTYTRGNLVLCANYFANEGKTTISYYDGPLSEKLVKDTTTAATGTNTTLHMIELFEYGNSFVVQLKNGHFLINDGGQAEDLPYLLDYLEELAGEDKPVVEGWFITHAHGDHTGAFNDFWNNRDWVNRVSVEGVYYSSPSDVILDAPECGTASLDHKIAQITSTLLRSEKDEATKLYRPQTGQKYYFDDITIDILLAQEQLPVDASTARTNLNSSSTVCLFTFEAGTENAQTCLISGDLQEAGFDIMFANYSETLFSTLDFFALNHHGFNTSAKIASMITANTILLTVRDKTPVRCETAIKTLIEKADESMAWGNGTVVFAFPHVAGTNSYTVLPSKETVDEDGNNGWIYNVGETREEQPNLDVGTDGTTSDDLE